MQSHNEHVLLPLPWGNRTHVCPSPIYQLQRAATDTTHPSATETYRGGHHSQGGKKQHEPLRAAPLFHPRPQPARCLQPELDAFLNQLTQCSTQNLMDQCFSQKNHCCWGGCIFKPSCLFISVLNSVTASTFCTDPTVWAASPHVIYTLFWLFMPGTMDPNQKGGLHFLLFAAIASWHEQQLTGKRTRN